MARINKQYQRTAANQARAEIAPQIQSKRRGLHQDVAALRSEEDPLQEGLSASLDTIKHSNIGGASRQELLASIAQQQASVPAGITSQIAGARENTGGEISDLQTQEAQQRASILSGLLTKAAEHKEGIQDEIAAEGRGNATALALAQQEKELGLGDYAPTPAQEQTPLEEQVETAGLHHIQAETAAEQAKAEGGGLTPSEQRTVAHEGEARKSEREAAQLSAKKLFEGAKAGEIEGVPADPKEWTQQTYAELVPAVVALSKKYGTEINTTDAQHALGAIQDHLQPQQGSLPFGLTQQLAAAAGAALSGHTQTPPGTSPQLHQQIPGARY